MRKILGLVAIVLGFMACESDVKFNDPGMLAEMTEDVITDTVVLKQLVFNNSLRYNRYGTFKPQDFKALVANGRSIVLEAKTDSTKLVIYVPEYEFGTRYDFNKNTAIKAAYYIIDENDNEIGVYNTETSDAALERPGYIEFDPVEKQVPNTISGTFVINMGAAVLPKDVLNEKGKLAKTYVDRKTFQKGVFYRIPLKPAN